MNRERVIVYIDENIDDGMMWEELNQEGKMQVSVYDEELEYDVEYSHSIVVKSLQEYLAEHDKQVKKEMCDKIYDVLTTGTIWRLMKTTWNFTNDECEELRKLLDQIQGE